MPGTTDRPCRDLMDKITALIDSKGWTQAEAASRCGVTPPRMNDLLRGRLSVFSLVALVSMATALESHQDILMEQFISADVAWGLRGND